MKLRLPSAILFTILCATGRAAAAEPFTLVIKNGGMTQGEDVPVEWRGKFGDIEAARDAQVFKEAPAALRATVHGGKSGQVFQRCTGGAGAKVRIAGWMKVHGAVKAQAAVQAFAEGFTQNQFIQLHFADGETEWQSFEKEVQLPPWTSFFNVLLMAEGEGSAWLDEVRAGAAPVDPGQPESAQERMTSGPPTKALPSVPGWGFYPQFPAAWQVTFQGQRERTKRGGAELVFLGDSITQGWGNAGKEVWAKSFEPRGAVNYGIGGDSTRQALWRIEHGLLDGLAPKVVVLAIGTNNLYADFNGGSDEEIARGIEATVQAVRGKLPHTRVLLLGIFPRQNEFFSSRVVRINVLIAKLADGPAVRYLDLATHFARTPEKGEVYANLFDADQLHLAPAGYAVYAAQLEPLIAEMLPSAQP